MTLDRVPSVSPLPRPSVSAINPMVLPGPMLLPILDTNALLTEACYLVKHDYQQDKVTALAGTGRANPYVAAHVPGEIDEHLTKLADHYQVPERRVRRLLRQQILPAVRVVELEIRDHLAPQTRHIIQVDPGRDLRHRGDPDDAPTMALAEFLSPCVIVTQDSVFSRFGFAVIDWIPVAQSLLRLAGLEATAANGLLVIDVMLRASGAGAQRLVSLAARNPLPTAAAVGGLLLWGYRSGYLSRGDWRQRISRLGEVALPLLERGNAAMLEHRAISDSLLVVQPPAYPNPEQLAARYLARCGRPLTPGELRDALDRQGHTIPAAQLQRHLRAHRAFVRAPGDLWTVGRPVQELSDL
ncbi:PIN domain-containing protein [Streptomyces sp. NPDC048484]|uniref:PIN domain-containing protein n=1 Tax=Streptomyces sp. NPDC048484 TaxID=3155146 RepID=UPI0034332619